MPRASVNSDASQLSPDSIVCQDPRDLRLCWRGQRPGCPHSDVTQTGSDLILAVNACH